MDGEPYGEDSLRRGVDPEKRLIRIPLIRSCHRPKNYLDPGFQSIDPWKAHQLLSEWSNQ